MIATMVASSEPAKRLDGLRLAISLDVPLWGNWDGRGPDLPPDDRLRRFWVDRKVENVRTYAKTIRTLAADHTDIRYAALAYDVITTEQALHMHGSLLPLLQTQKTSFFGRLWGSYLLGRFYLLAHGWSDTEEDDISGAIGDLTAIGQYFRDHPQVPWIIGKADRLSSFWWDEPTRDIVRRSDVAPITYAGAAGIALISAESDNAMLADVLAGDQSREIISDTWDSSGRCVRQ